MAGRKPECHEPAERVPDGDDFAEAQALEQQGDPVGVGADSRRGRERAGAAVSREVDEHDPAPLRQPGGHQGPVGRRAAQAVQEDERRDLPRAADERTEGSPADRLDPLLEGRQQAGNRHRGRLSFRTMSSSRKQAR
jgi:hypothetical protein